MQNFGTFWFDAAGYLGAICFLGAYGALQAGLIRGGGYVFAGLNLAASALLLVALTPAWNVAYALALAVWIAASLAGLIRGALVRRRLQHNNDMRTIASRTFPEFDPLDLHRLLKLGRWKEIPEGVRLTEEGALVSCLSVISDGEVTIEHRGQKIATVGAGDMVGELGSLKSGMACATATTSQRTRLFSVPTERLATAMRRDPGFARRIELACAAATERKLLRTNQSLRNFLIQDPQAA